MDEIDKEIIADGVHLPAPLLKVIYKLKGTGRIALITDAMRAAGMQKRGKCPGLQGKRNESYC